MSVFAIKFTRKGFENACWHHEACQAIQQGFLKPSLVKLDIKRRKPGILFISLPIVFFLFLCWLNGISDVIQKVQRHHDLIKAHAVR